MTPTVQEMAAAVTKRLREDFPLFAEKFLKIRPKGGGLVPFELNGVQRELHRKIEEQLAATGRVRVLILKARQLGCSTYVEGRYYWKVIHRKGVRAFILTHKQDATENLFKLTDRFHDHCDVVAKPAVGKANAKELDFPGLDSGYKVGTAGTAGVGRSDTIQYFHGSEVAYWQNADEHVDGAIQAVPDEPGTEIVLESTAKGMGGTFYDMCKAAERGDSAYILIFIPWFKHDEYRCKPESDWVPPENFAEYGRAHGLDAEQLYWAFTKNRELANAIGADPDKISWKFKQEYPATAEEAFQTGGDEQFVRSELVALARRNTVKPNEKEPLILGVDSARGGPDKTRLLDRQGRKAGGHLNVTLDTDDTMVIAGRVAKEIDRLNPALVNVDVGGVGAGVYDRLKELGYAGFGKPVHAVNFAGTPVDEKRWANKRAEMWGEMAEWFADPAGVDIPDDDTLHSHICAPIWGKGATRENSSGRIVLESKDHIKERLHFSPDGGDALALTFASRVHKQWAKIKTYPELSLA